MNSIAKAFRRSDVRYAAACVLVAMVVVVSRLLHPNVTAVGFGLLIVVLAISASWGLRCAIVFSVLATLAYNYYFFPPTGTFTIADPENWIALFAFLITAVIASELSERARRAAENANSRRDELEQLYVFSQTLLTAENVLSLVNLIPGKVVENFGTAGAALYSVHSRKVYYSGLETQALVSKTELEQVSSRSEPVSDSARKLRIRPLRIGLRSEGALAVVGGEPSSKSVEAVASLTAIAIERAAAVEKLAHSEAGRESERLRAVLLDSVTHEFRTPLTAIKAAAQSLEGDAQLDEAGKKDLLAVISEECDRLDRLVGEASEMSMLDAGALELELNPHNILEPIAAAIDHNQKSLARHEVVLDVSDKLPLVKMDLKRAQEIISQLLENASKYSPPGTRITITAEPQGNMMVTSVADHGPGIDGIDQNMIFDKFYRGRNQRYSVQGTGMGLAIAKAIVEAHGGTIWLTTQLERGSVFSFTLPLSR